MAKSKSDIRITADSRGRYGESIVRILEEIDRVITAPRCINVTWACFFKRLPILHWLWSVLLINVIWLTIFIYFTKYFANLPFNVTRVTLYFQNSYYWNSIASTPHTGSIWPFPSANSSSQRAIDRGAREKMQDIYMYVYDMYCHTYIDYIHYNPGMRGVCNT